MTAKINGPGAHVKGKIKVKKPIIDSDVIKSIVDVNYFFNGDIEKVALWFRLDNLNFGGVSPDFLIQCGRAKKLAQFINAALEQNKTIKSPRQTKSRRIGNGPQGAGAR